jgi:hypothetical protein
MVLIHMKRADDNQFLFETTTTTSCDEVIRKLVEVHNLRLKILRLVNACEDLIKYGPAKPPDQQGIDDYQVQAAEKKAAGGVYVQDPCGKRIGFPPAEELAEVIKKTLSDATTACSVQNVEMKKCLNVQDLGEALDGVRGALMIAYPEGLPLYDPVSAVLDEEEEETQDTKLILDADTACLWWANKQFERGNKMSDHIGKNEKTKIVAKLATKGAGAPVREPMMSKDEQKDMMQYYYKKQEEFKKLQTDQDDSYLNSKWADSQSLKQSLTGTQHISWRPR